MLSRGLTSARQGCGRVTGFAYGNTSGSHVLGSAGLGGVVPITDAPEDG